MIPVAHLIPRVELPAQIGKQETHAFAYSSLSRWLSRKTGENEEWEIHFGKQSVIVLGRGLGKLIDALDEGRLKLIRICPSELNQAQPWIKELTVKVGMGTDKAELAAS